MYLVSACLLGIDCKYDGRNNRDDVVLEFLKDKDYVLACPEQLGGLSTPRLPSEIKELRVIDIKGRDVTEEFEKGALETLKISKMMGVTKAILKERSPSCGVLEIYDGAFNKNIVKGKGITTRLLENNGIEVFSDESIKLKSEIENQTKEKKDDKF